MQEFPFNVVERRWELDFLDGGIFAETLELCGEVDAGFFTDGGGVVGLTCDSRSWGWRFDDGLG